MKDVIRRRARIARVRRAQHLQASADATIAENRVNTLENQAVYLVKLAGDLDAQPGMMTGAALSNAAELAQRLRAARDGLLDVITGARATAFERSLKRVEARIKQESAERLDARARHHFEAFTERKRATSQRRKRRFEKWGEDA